MPQCEATASTPGRPNFGQRCSRPAVTGSIYCSSHDGVKYSVTPSKTRKRKEKPAVRCSATKRNGEPCNRYALKGATVCTSHGGNLPSIRESAREKLLALVLPAISELEQVLSSATTAPSEKLRAIQIILDRTGYGTKSELEVTVKPWEATLKGIMRSAPPNIEHLEAVTIMNSYEDIQDAELIEDPVERELRREVVPKVIGSNRPPLHPDLRRGQGRDD